MRNQLTSVITAIIFFLIGVVCLFFPDKIQMAALKYYAEHPTAGKLNPFFDWIKSPSYVVSLRLIGLIGIVAFVFILIVLVKGR